MTQSGKFHLSIFKNSRLSRRSFISKFLPGLLLSLFILSGFTNPESETMPALAEKWVGTWSTAPQLVEPRNMPPAPGLSNNTLRQIVCISIGGESLRMRFSNEFSKSPVTMRNRSDCSVKRRKCH